MEQEPDGTKGMGHQVESALDNSISDTLLQEFEQSLRGLRNLSPLTTKAYVSDLRMAREWIQTRNGHLTGMSFGTCLTRYLFNLAENQRYRDTTVKRKIASLRKYLGFVGRERGTYSLDLADFRYKTEERLPRVMTDSEFSSFLQSVYADTKRATRNNSDDLVRYLAHRDRAYFDLLFSTGARIGELCAADIQDLALDSGTLLIRGKGRRQRLVNFIHPTTLETLKGYLGIRMDLRTKDQALFLNRRYARLAIHSVESLFRKYSTKAHITRHLTPHSVRHAVATGLLRNGADIRVVQVILGHSSIVMTQRYTHVSQPMVSSSLEKFGPRNQVQV